MSNPTVGVLYALEELLRSFEEEASVQPRENLSDEEQMVYEKLREAWFTLHGAGKLWTAVDDKERTVRMQSAVDVANGRWVADGCRL